MLPWPQKEWGRERGGGAGEHGERLVAMYEGRMRDGKEQERQPGRKQGMEGVRGGIQQQRNNGKEGSWKIIL